MLVIITYLNTSAQVSILASVESNKNWHRF